MTYIYWEDEYKWGMYGAHRKDGIPGSGTLVNPTAPFKGVCQRCGKRLNVRHYPYSPADNNFGVYCEHCMKEIDEEMSAPDEFPEEEL